MICQWHLLTCLFSTHELEARGCQITRCELHSSLCKISPFPCSRNETGTPHFYSFGRNAYIRIARLRSCTQSSVHFKFFWHSLLVVITTVDPHARSHDKSYDLPQRRSHRTHFACPALPAQNPLPQPQSPPQNLVRLNPPLAT